jgi:hypothetical protein
LGEGAFVFASRIDVIANIFARRCRVFVSNIVLGKVHNFISVFIVLALPERTLRRLCPRLSLRLRDQLRDELRDPLRHPPRP